MTYPRRAFTLVELLVVLAITAALMGLLLPAVQKVRAAAARADCQNRLRQLALACHQHHDAARHFPTGWRSPRGPFASRKYSGWTVSILPYLEQASLYSISEADYDRAPSPFRGQHRGLGTALAAFACPADGRTASPQRAVLTGQTVGLTSYLGVSGTTTAARDGVLYRDSRSALSDITDGSSNTLLLGERPPSPDFQFGWWYAGTGLAKVGTGEMVLGLREPNIGATAALRDCPRGRYRFMPGSVTSPCDVLHFWSLHPGGANFALADGSVRFVGYEAHPLLPAMATRAGQEAADGDF